MSAPEEQTDAAVAENADDLIDLSESSDLGSSLLNFQVDNAEVYAHSDGPTISSEAGGQQQLRDLMDHFDVDVGVQDIQFSEFREGNTDDELIEIHGGVELPDLPEIRPNQLGIAELAAMEDNNVPLLDTLPGIPSEGDSAEVTNTNRDNKHTDSFASPLPAFVLPSVPESVPVTTALEVVDAVEDLHSILPDIVGESAAVGSVDVNVENAQLAEPALTSPGAETKSVTHVLQVDAIDDCKEMQIRYMREIIQSVGDLLTDQVPGSTVTVPDTFNEESAGQIVTTFASLIAQLSARKTPNTTSSTASKASVSISKPSVPVVGSEQPAWPDLVSQKNNTATDGESEWEENNDTQPVPDYGLESPVISHLLNTWTTDTSKVTYVLSTDLKRPTLD